MSLPFSPIQSTCTIRGRVGLLAELSEQPRYGAGHGPAYGLDLTAVIACAREHAAAEH
jgi:hypothetical protein